VQSEETVEDMKEDEVYKTIAEYVAAVGGTRDDLYFTRDKVRY
jgi:hypothetical protein